MVLTCGIPPEFRGGVHLFIIYKIAIRHIGSVPSLSGHAIAYRWRSLLRVRRHRASKPQDSSKRVLLPCWQVTMDQLMGVSLSHTHYYWYEVGTIHQTQRTAVFFSQLFFVASRVFLWNSASLGSARSFRIIAVQFMEILSSFISLSADGTQRAIL